MKRVPGTICRREMQEGNNIDPDAVNQKKFNTGGINHWTRIPEKGC